MRVRGDCVLPTRGLRFAADGALDDERAPLPFGGRDRARAAIHRERSNRRESKAEEVAARENAATTRRFKDLPVLLERVLNASRSQESRELALHVQHAMASELLETPTRELYKGVRTAPFHVLVGAGMPAVLIEAGYLSNSEDAANLAVPSYRQQVADAIARGIRSYLGALSGGAASPELTPTTPDTP